MNNWAGQRVRHAGQCFGNIKRRSWWGERPREPARPCFRAVEHGFGRGEWRFGWPECRSGWGEWRSRNAEPHSSWGERQSFGGESRSGWGETESGRDEKHPGRGETQSIGGETGSNRGELHFIWARGVRVGASLDIPGRIASRRGRIPSGLGETRLFGGLFDFSTPHP
jgi:hypothetical protein